MIILIGLILLSGIAVEGVVKNCDNGTIIYRDIGCKPSCQKETESGCPLYYKCNEYKLKNDTCLFSGTYYNVGENIKGTERCTSCSCIHSFIEGKIKASCSIQTCITKVPGDYPAYENMDACCAQTSGWITANTTKCVSDGTTYYEGQRFYPLNSCIECLCQKGYAGVYKAPFCRRVKCDSDIENSDKIVNKCAPVYDRGMKCCPSNFLCPEDMRKAVTIKLELDASVKIQNNQCWFGLRRMAINGSFVARISGTKVNCTCDVPPLVTCTI